MKELKPDERHPNRDPLTGEPGSHPVGVAAGTAAGAGTGAVVGAAAGPLGAVAGAVVGGVAGAFAGKSAAELVNPTVEDTYWRKNFSTRPYVAKNDPYALFQKAFEVGYLGFAKYGLHGKSYDDVEDNLRSEYEALADQSELDWSRARYAASDAWQNVEQRIPIPGHRK